jgi:hypothetical protein
MIDKNTAAGAFWIVHARDILPRAISYIVMYRSSKNTLTRLRRTNCKVNGNKSCVVRFRVWNTSSLVTLTADYINAAVFCNKTS